MLRTTIFSLVLLFVLMPVGMIEKTGASQSDGDAESAAQAQPLPPTIDLATPGSADTIIHNAVPGDDVCAFAIADFNNDGMDDLAIGLCGADGPGNTRVNAGEVVIFFGSIRTIKGTVWDRARLAGRGPDITIFGAESEDNAGGSLAAGDVNGDGIADLIIGAYHADGPMNARRDAGEVYVIFGGPHLLSGTLRDLAGQAGRGADITIYGSDFDDQMGVSVASGDVNGDGIRDIIIGAFGGDSLRNERTDAGEAYIIFGSRTLTSGTVRDIASRAGRGPDITIIGGDGGDWLGYSVASGDVDGDGIDDLIVGAVLADGPENRRRDAGEAYIIFGSIGLTSGSVRDVVRQAGGAPDVTIFGADGGDHLAVSVASGDINGDGIKDVIVGADMADGPNNGVGQAGEVYVIFGGSNLRSGTVRDVTFPLPLGADVTIFGAGGEDRLGFSVAAGDINGDGIDDLLTGARGGDGPRDARPDTGETYAILGSPDIVSGTVRDIAGQVGRGAEVTIFGETRSDFSGLVVAAGDINGDRVADIIIGAPFADGPDNARGDAGQTYIVFGRGQIFNEVERNDNASQANFIRPNVIVRGRINPAGDEDFFAFDANANQLLIIGIRAQLLNPPSLADIIVMLFDSDGNQIAENDDFEGSLDSFLRLRIPSSGRYTLRVRNASSKGGLAFSYEAVVTLK
jgi:hypothetical protein